MRIYLDHSVLRNMQVTKRIKIYERDDYLFFILSIYGIAATNFLFFIFWKRRRDTFLCDRVYCCVMAFQSVGRSLTHGANLRWLQIAEILGQLSTSVLLAKKNVMNVNIVLLKSLFFSVSLSLFLKAQITHSDGLNR